ncbi:MAG TPA: class I SAM-dependent methyltransferase [Candidatus Hydrogenedens sp.]|nr:class I SAM-dependent methyltransferase [Candidatus Hydrogenedens sp.]HOK10281.1 class I SAM-dependent methyltransferase [Candidatus Hydrogenedens sp.]HPP59491.1 class I SAM-dependent methyltransferase [Candidatus Hydrogenedens sp.]
MNSKTLENYLDDNNSYQLIDSGDRVRLEQIGPYKVIRPAPEACYPKSLPELWNKDIDAIYLRSSEGGGHWEYRRLIPQQFPVSIKNLHAYAKLTGFGHIGFFPEHYHLWNLLLNLKVENSSDINVLNLFAYTGLSTVACVKKGFNVCHVDSSKGMVELAKMNMVLNNLDNSSARWMVEDVKKFVSREVRRDKTYNGFILDPPSFGRGPKNEVWKLEQHISALFEDLMILCNYSPLFVFFTCYSSGFTPLILERLLKTFIKSDGIFLSGELAIKEASGYPFSSGGLCSVYIRKDIAPQNISIFQDF